MIRALLIIVSLLIAAVVSAVLYVVHVLVWFRRELDRDGR